MYYLINSGKGFLPSMFLCNDEAMIAKHLSNSALRTYLILCMLTLMHTAIGQSADSTEKISYFGGSVSLTNNGISFVPSFSLGKPAALFNMKVGRKLSFEPELRFSLEGKPWAFIFWWRYKFLSDRRFQVRVGAHPSILFATVPVTVDGVSNDQLIARRYIAAELSPDFYITKKISVGMYYLKGYGLQDNAVRNTDFITLNAKFSDIRLSKKLSLYLYPQLYYLRMDDTNGYYFSSAQGLVIKGFPLSLQNIINVPIESDVVGGQDFVWNVSLIYSFGNQYRPVQRTAGPLP